MVSLNPANWGKKEEKPKDLKTQLGDLGVDIIKDDFFTQSLENIDENAEVITQDIIDKMNLSDLRKALMKKNSDLLKYVMHHIPHAKAIEKRRFGEAMEAAIDLLHEDYRRIMSKSTDEAVIAEVTEDWSQINILVGYSFDSERVSVNKSIVVQTISKHDNRYGTEEEEL